jgi:hypothetical protein
MNIEDFHRDQFYDDYVRGRLSSEEEDLFEEHLLFCEHCRREIEMREAIVAGLASNENTHVQKASKHKRSQRTIFIRLGIAASVLIIAGYFMFSILTSPKDPEIADREEPDEQVTVPSEGSIDTILVADSIPGMEPDKRTENMISEAFIPSPMFENAIENQLRAEGLNILAPDNSKIFKTNDTIEFQWENGGEQLTLVVFNNKGSIIFEKEIEPPFTLRNKLQPGLYYWQLETEDEALGTFKFTVE